MQRPDCRNEGDIRTTFHLREIASVSLDNFNESLWLFGNTSERNSITVRVENFKPYLYVDCPPGLQDIDGWLALINEDMRPWPSAPDIILSAERCNRINVIGYSDNQSNVYLKLTYSNQANIKRVRAHFAKPVPGADGAPPHNLRMYHDDWTVASLFLNETGLKLQEWVQVDAYLVLRRRTTCDIEKYAPWENFAHVAAPVLAVPPILCCALRMRASSKSARMPTPEHDPVTMLAAEIYWLGDETDHYVKDFGDECETTLLRRFEREVRDLDIDCFVFLSDNVNPINYIIKRMPNIRLSKFLPTKKPFFSADKKGRLQHPGASSMDLKHALEKMQLGTKLDGFTLKAAVFHPDIVRGNPDVRMLTYKFIEAACLSKDVQRAQCLEELHWLVKVEQHPSKLLEFVSASASNNVPLTDVITNGQQIRVWNKLIEFVHKKGDLIINKEQLKQTPLIVHDVPDSFPDPPVVPNVRQQQPTSTKKVQRNLLGRPVDTSTKKKKAVAGGKKRKLQQSSGDTSDAKSCKLSGGLVVEPKRGFYEDDPVATLDFSSLYPSIIRGWSICYGRLVYDKKYLTACYKKTFISISPNDYVVLIDGKTNEDGSFTPARTIVPEMIKTVMMQRTAVRRVMKTTTDPFLLAVLNATQLSCKVTANAAYGFFGTPDAYGLLSCPVLMAVICKIGQYMLKTTIHAIITQFNAYVVYGDTDSVMVIFPHPKTNESTKEAKLAYCYEKAREAAASVTKNFPYPNDLEFEGVKWSYLLLEKKNYACLEYGAKSWRIPPQITVKGMPFKKRDRCPMVRTVGWQVLKYILFQQREKIAPYVNQVMDGIKDVPIEQLIITCQLKRPEEYKQTSLIQVATAKKITARTGTTFEAGDRLSYVVLAPKDKNEKHYMRGEDPVFAKAQGLKLDLCYYVETQLGSALTKLLQFCPQVDMCAIIKHHVQKVSIHQAGIRQLGTR